MKTITDILRDADPLRDDMRRLDEERDRLRQIVVAATSDATAPSSALFRPRRAAIVAVSVVVVALGTIGLQIWSEGGATLQAAVRFEVRLAEERPIPGLVYTPLPGSNRVIYLHHEIVATNGDISQSRVLPGEAAGQFWVGVGFSQAGAQKIRRATANHIGRPIAILIDGAVVAVPVLRAPISESAVISGGFTRAEAERIADGIGVR